MIACSVGLVTLGACGDDDDNPGTNGSGGKGGSAGTGGTAGTPSGGSAGSTTGGMCKTGIDACAGNEKCAKALGCVLECGRQGVETLTALQPCLTAVGATTSDLGSALGTLSTCRMNAACGSRCMPAPAAGAGGAPAAGAGGAPTAGAGGDAGGDAGGAAGSAAGGAGGSAGGTLACTQVPAVPVPACGAGAEDVSDCFACFCDN